MFKCSSLSSKIQTLWNITRMFVFESTFQKKGNPASFVILSVYNYFTHKPSSNRVWMKQKNTIIYFER